MQNQNNRSDFISVFLGEHLGNNFDWVKCGTYFRNFAFPSKIPDDVVFYADGLKECIPEKLKDALEAQEKLEELRKMRIKMILDFIPGEHQWFFLLLEVHLFAEYFLIGAWIRYWLNIWGKINVNYKPPILPSSRVSDFDIQKAREHLIQNLYSGQLRKSGKRFFGLCPFHKENHPSFYIFENNRFFCFGCNTGGDSIAFLMKFENIRFIEAVRRLS